MIKKENNRLTLENEWLRREIVCGDGIISKTYHTRPNGSMQDVWYPVFSFEDGVPFEAALTVDGIYYEACPYYRDTSNDNTCKRGAFVFDDALLGKGTLGDTAEIIMTPRFEGMPNIELHICYELCADMPLMKKYIRIVNRSEKDVLLDNVTVDILRFFDRKISLSAFTDYYWDTRSEDKYYVPWTRIGFPDDIGVVLSPNEDFITFTLYEAVTAVDRQGESYALHRAFKRIAPWVKMLAPAVCTNSCTSIKELHELADRLSDNGLEMCHLHVGQVFTNTGDYVPRPDIFPNGYEDVKKVVAYFHKKNLKIMTYCSTTIANHSSRVCSEHPDWQYLGPQGMRYSPEGLGNMCYQSPWGDYIREKLMFLLDEVGFDGLALDGPYHSLPCLEKSHKHKTDKAVRYMNWAWEKKFYADVAAKGKLINVPQVPEALLLGANKTPAGYREEDQNEFGGMPLVSMTRACVSESRYSTPSCCHWTSFNIESYHDHSIEIDENNTATYEHAIAGMLGYGFDGIIFGKYPYTGKNTKKVYDKWIKLFRDYRETFLGEFIHIEEPTGVRPDAMMHAAPEAPVPALIIAFNPTDKPQPFTFTAPLRYAGFKAEQTAKLNGNTVKLDASASASVNITLSPFEVRVLTVNR